jgi:hypothetical protein
LVAGEPVVRSVERCSELLLILKWGGDLTKLGERQAERLGERFTQAMYPDPTYVITIIIIIIVKFALSEPGRSRADRRPELHFGD